MVNIDVQWGCVIVWMFFYCLSCNLCVR